MGTEYRITYPFKKYYSYKITVRARRQFIGTPQGGDVLLRLDMNSGGTGVNNGCTGPQLINTTQIGGYKISKPVVASGYFDFVFEWNSLADYQSYLMIAAFLPGTNAEYQDVYIRTITIEESLNIDFNLTPSSFPITCGSATSQNFAITPNDVPGVTYEWSLPSSNNGWLYSGSPAPQIIPSTTSSTLSLTPVCGVTQQNVTATIKVNNVNYRAYSTNITSVSPSLSISGNSSLCSGSTNYTLNGLVCNSSITWTPPPSSLGSLSSLTASPTTLTYGGTSGSFTLTANVTSCGVTTPVTLPVHTGAYTGADYTFSCSATISGVPLYWCPNQTYTFILGGNPSTNHSWSLPTAWTMLGNSGGTAVIKSPSGTNPPTGTVSVNFTEPCGTGLSAGKSVIYNTNGCSGVGIYTVYPSPASTTITIACASLQTYCNISSVDIIDALSGAVLSSQSWPYTNQQVQMNVSFMGNGPKIARIYSGSAWYSVTFNVQH